MSLQTTEINSVKVTFDKDKTKAYRTSYNKPCDCPDCINYYEHIKNNSELIEFLNGFGIDYNYTEDIFSWNLTNNDLFHYESYYGVFGRIEGEDFDFEKFGVKITFSKGAFVPSDRSGEYFWICVEADFSYILDVDREASKTLSQRIERVSFFDKLKSIFRLN